MWNIDLKIPFVILCVCLSRWSCARARLPDLDSCQPRRGQLETCKEIVAKEVMSFTLMVAVHHSQLRSYRSRPLNNKNSGTSRRNKLDCPDLNTPYIWALLLDMNFKDMILLVMNRALLVIKHQMEETLSLVLSLTKIYHTSFLPGTFKMSHLLYY